MNVRTISGQTMQLNIADYRGTSRLYCPHQRTETDARERLDDLPRLALVLPADFEVDQNQSSRCVYTVNGSEKQFG